MDHTSAIRNIAGNASRHPSGFFGSQPQSCSAEFAATTHIGKRRTTNEDHYAIIQRSRARKVIATNLPADAVPDMQECAYVMAVADGVAGHNSGEVASMLALQVAGELGIREINWAFRMNDREVQETRAKIQAYGEAIQQALVEFSNRIPDSEGMATTLTVVYVVGDNAFVGHIGDSRAYLFRNNYLMQLTEDHTLYVPRSKGETQQVPDNMPRFRRVLMNALGIRSDMLYVETNHLQIMSGDLLMVCSDGLTNMLPDNDIADTINKHTQIQGCCDALLEKALDRGGKDNITICMGRFMLDDVGQALQ